MTAARRRPRRVGERAQARLDLLDRPRHTSRPRTSSRGSGCLHPRKALVADFNDDGRPDVFVACHGYDAAPFPGERNKVVLSQPGGGYAVSDAATDIGFNHGASAADLNGDGLPDVVVVSFFEPDRGYVLINDGTGHFVRDSTSRLPTAMQGGTFFSVELVDVDEDGHLDLLVGGHEFDNATRTSIFLILARTSSPPWPPWCCRPWPTREWFWTSP
jgi:hypothetical protein